MAPAVQGHRDRAGGGEDLTGDWARGQRDAQIEACRLVSAFLDDAGLASRGSCSVAETGRTSGSNSESGTEESEGAAESAARGHGRQKVELTRLRAGPALLGAASW